MLFREWLVISILLGFLGFIVFVSKYSKIRSFSELENAKKEHSIIINLSGAIDAPGEYQCPPGTTLKNLLNQVRLLPEANRKKIPFKKILFTSQSIEIPKKLKKFSNEEKISLKEN